MKKRMDNKGFSLVELIIVIAIMAILIGIVGSQVIPYIEKSRVSKDKDTLDACYTALQAAVAKEDINSFKDFTLADLKNAPKNGGTINLADEITESIGNGITDDKSLGAKFGSKQLKTKANGTVVLFNFNAKSGVISVYAKGDSTAGKGGAVLISSESGTTEDPDDSTNNAQTAMNGEQDANAKAGSGL